MELINKTALVTGASSGIRNHLGKLFVGNNFGLIARKEEDLDRLSQITVIPKILSIPEPAAEVYDETQRQGTVVNILVNDNGDALINELKDTNIILPTLIPAPTNTEAFNKRDMGNTVGASKTYDAEKVVITGNTFLNERGTSCC